MTAKADENQPPLFCIATRIGPISKPGAFLDQLFMLRFPNVIATSNITIPYLAKSQQEDSVIIALKMFSFAHYLQ